MFFGVDISYVVEELNNRIELRRFAKMPEITETKKFQIYEQRGMLTYPLSMFNHPYPEKEKKFFNRLATDLINMLDNWKEYRSISGMI
jgi:hypothetical protein